MKRTIIILAVLLIAGAAYAAEYDHQENIASGGASVFLFAGERINFEAYSDAADCVLKIQHRIATVWTDFQPSDGSSDDTLRLFAGVPWAENYNITRYTVRADSTRVLVTPDATTDVQVRAW